METVYSLGSVCSLLCLQALINFIFTILNALSLCIIPSFHTPIFLVG